MHRIVQNSSGKVAGTGRTFLSTFLYLRTKSAGSTGGSRGRLQGTVNNEDKVILLAVEIMLTVGARPTRGRVDR